MQHHAIHLRLARRIAQHDEIHEHTGLRQRFDLAIHTFEVAAPKAEGFAFVNKRDVILTRTGHEQAR
jgi:hypothetical protein